MSELCFEMARIATALEGIARILGEIHEGLPTATLITEGVLRALDVAAKQFEAIEVNIR